MKLRMASLLLAVMLLTACSVPEWLGGSVSEPESSSSDSSSSSSQSQPQVMGPPKVEYQQGTVDEDRYESAFYNLQFVPPEGTTLGTAEEITALQQQATELVGADSELVDRAEVSLTYEFMAVAPKTQANLVAITEDVRSAQITPIQYLTAAKTLIETQLANVTAEFDGDPVLLDLAGHSFGKLRYKTTMEGVGSLWQETYVTLIDNRALVLTLTYQDTPEAAADAQALLAGLVLPVVEESESSESQSAS